MEEETQVAAPAEEVATPAGDAPVTPESEEAAAAETAEEAAE